MNYEQVVDYLNDQGFSVLLEKLHGARCLIVKVQFEHYCLEFVHFCIDEISSLPSYCIKDPKIYGSLSHVLPFGKLELGCICIGDQDSISINYELPHLAFEESLSRHITLIQKNLSNPDWNQSELLREFYSNWLNICPDANKDIVCAATGYFEKIEVLNSKPNQHIGIGSQYIGITPSVLQLSDFSYMVRQQKNRSKAGEGFVIPIDNLKPAPTFSDQVSTWYLDSIRELTLPPQILHTKSKVFWLIFNANTPSGRTWFGLHFSNNGKGKKTLPVKASSLINWKITPIGVKIFNKDRLMPRSGANTSLDKKSVLVVGCGSVGGEIVLKLGAAGVGQITLCDPDIYTLDNLYRHVLDDHFIGCSKSLALKYVLESKFPWIKTEALGIQLLDLRDKEFLESFDLIVIAIGSPTHERIFHDYIVTNNIKTPIINTWLEGYGIGGHAILDIRSSKGCLRCAYVNMERGARGLSSNLNFLESNQNVTVNHAGCGELYLPYNAISAAQTALITSNLAIKFLMGGISESSKVSWKGDHEEVTERGFDVTHRFTAFKKSLDIMPLYNEDCDLCHD